jgi:5-formyltetrahydrofolate cyclo-ligase
MNANKQTIRREVRSARRALSADVIAAAAAAVAVRARGFDPFRNATAVLAYLPHDNEVPTAALIEATLRRGQRIYLPRMGLREEIVCWAPGEPLRASAAGGVLEPAAGHATVPAAPAIAFLPLVAWDERGTRLGRGGGFYDRFFARLPEVFVRVGLAYELQQRPQLPRDPWDVPLDFIITEQRIVEFERDRFVHRPMPRKGELQLE